MLYGYHFGFLQLLWFVGQRVVEVWHTIHPMDAGITLGKHGFEVTGTVACFAFCSLSRNLYRNRYGYVNYTLCALVAGAIVGIGTLDNLLRSAAMQAGQYRHNYKSAYTPGNNTHAVATTLQFVIIIIAHKPNSFLKRL
jgi:hypothetical protein